MNCDDYLAIISLCGGQWIELPQKDRWRALQQWREVYAVGLHTATGHWKDGKFEWHAFLRGHVRVVNGGKAAAAYHAERPTSIVTYPEDSQLPAVRMVEARLPDFRPQSADVLVWPEDLSWTMAFTHEESLGLGPYFTRREWIDAAGVGEGRKRQGMER